MEFYRRRGPWPLALEPSSGLDFLSRTKPSSNLEFYPFLSLAPAGPPKGSLNLATDKAFHSLFSFEVTA